MDKVPLSLVYRFRPTSEAAIARKIETRGQSLVVFAVTVNRDLKLLALTTATFPIPVIVGNTPPSLQALHAALIRSVVSIGGYV